MDSESHPVAGVDYPRTFEEMELWFRDHAACQSYIRRLRWPGGFICPHCGVGVHLPLQPPPLTGTGPAVPPPCRASRGGCPGALPRHHRKASKSSRFRGVGSVKGISHIKRTPINQRPRPNRTYFGCDHDEPSVRPRRQSQPVTGSRRNIHKLIFCAPGR